MALRTRVPSLLGTTANSYYRNAVGPGISAYDRAQLARRLWTPRHLGTKPHAWYDAQDVATITTVSGVVSQWSDKSGNARHATQGTAGDRPTFGVGLLGGGFPAIRFGNGAQRGLDVPNMSGYTSAEAFTVEKAVGDPPAAAGAGAALGDFGSSTITDFTPFTDGVVYSGFASTTRHTAVNPTPSLASTRIVSFRSSSANWQLVLDTTVLFTDGTNTVGFNASASPAGAVLGRSAANWWDGWLSEVILLGYTATAFERQRIEGYLSHRWGLTANLPASHPYRNTPPLIGDSALRVRYQFSGVVVSVGAAQIAVPISDITDGSWLNELGSNTNLYASLDETVASDTDYIISSSLASGASDTCEVGLTVLGDPASSADHVVSYRYKVAGTGSMNFTVRLMEGATIIASWSHTSVSTTYAVATQTLSGAEADSITNYGDLRLRFVATGA